MWVKATDLDGNTVWLNMLQARFVVAGEDGGSAVMFGEDDGLDVREEPEQLVRGETRWPSTSEGVGFIPRLQPGTTPAISRPLSPGLWMRNAAR